MALQTDVEKLSFLLEAEAELSLCGDPSTLLGPGEELSARTAEEHRRYDMRGWDRIYAKAPTVPVEVGGNDSAGTLGLGACHAKRRKLAKGAYTNDPAGTRVHRRALSGWVQAQPVMTLFTPRGTSSQSDQRSRWVGATAPPLGRGFGCRLSRPWRGRIRHPQARKATNGRGGWVQQRPRWDAGLGAGSACLMARKIYKIPSCTVMDATLECSLVFPSKCSQTIEFSEFLAPQPRAARPTGGG